MIVPRHVLGRGFTAPSDLLNIAGVGVGGMGRANLINLASQNIVAVCDVDWGYVDKVYAKADSEIQALRTRIDSRDPQPAPRPPQYQDAAERVAPKPFQPAPRGPFDQGRNGRDLFAAPGGPPQAQMPRDDGDPARRGNPGAFIDQELRTRVDGDIAVFLAAFDAALASDTQESRFGLREATDRLLRAGARTRIELERLEARVPLTPRDSGVQADPGAWRHR